MSNYVISCCSTVDLNKQQLEDRDIKYIYFHYELDGKQYDDDLWETMSSADFYRAMEEGADTKTSQVNAGEFEVVSVGLTDADGKAITKADLVAGDKVYASVTYQNLSGEDETFTLLGATYAEGRMTDTNFKNITALGSVKTEVTETVELDVTDVTELEIKAFTVESLANLKLFGTPVVK